MSAFLNFVTNDWYFAVPLFLMSLIGIGLVLWRLLLNINGDTAMNEFLPVFQDKLEKEGLNKALAYCRGRTDIVPHRLFVAGLETYKQGMAAVRRAMANVIELEILPDLNFLLPSILAIAKVATMVGLFVTVISMIGTFNAIQQSKSDVTGSAGAIGLALFGTAMGLVCAIPLVFTHVLFKAWVAQFEVKMKSSAQKLILLLQAYKDKGEKGGSKDGASSSLSAATGPAPPSSAKPAEQPSVVRR
jgi:biopolymer transport protein ExbB